MSNNFKEVYLWKYNKSGRIPHHVLVEMVEKENLSFNAIGLFIWLMLRVEGDQPFDTDEIQKRTGHSIQNSLEELKKFNYILSDETVEWVKENNFSEEEE